MLTRRADLDTPTVLALGFGTSTALWGVGYLCRLPAVLAPSALVLGLMLVTLLVAGFVAGRRTGAGFRAGAAAGAVSSLLNLLVLGSLLSGDRPNQVVPSALAWVPGSIAAAVLLCGLGAVLGTRLGRRVPVERDCTAAFARVAVATTLLLLFVGGLVTSAGAGLAVVDWPRSYGYTMFLYPLSRMTGGIYYEHAHRLFGSLVGITTLVLAVLLYRGDDRAWVRRLGLAAAALVVLQGILGGLRVTGHFTLSDSPEATSPNVYLAVVHGVLAQLVFALLVAIAAVTSRSFKAGRAHAVPGGAADRIVAWSLVGVLVVQLVLGATLRHLGAALFVHAGLGTALLPLASFAGARALDPAPERRALRRSGFLLISVALLQVTLGLATLVATRMLDPGPLRGGGTVAIATLHQGTGAIVLASAVLVAIWNVRFRAPYAVPAAEPSVRQTV